MLIDFGQEFWFAFVGIFCIFLVWLLSRAKDHDCIFEYPDEEIRKNLLTFLKQSKVYPKYKLHCPECDSVLEIRKGITRNPKDPRFPYRSVKSWVCAKHNYGWEVELS